jgi:hypothetical protein
MSLTPVNPTGIGPEITAKALVRLDEFPELGRMADTLRRGIVNSTREKLRQVLISYNGNISLIPCLATKKSG